MFFPFSDYIVLPISEDSSGDNLLYTVPANNRAIIFVGDIGSEPDGSLDAVTIYGKGSGDRPDKIIYEAYGSSRSESLLDGRGRGLHVFDGGTQIRAIRNDESINGNLYIFLLPSV